MATWSRIARTGLQAARNAMQTQSIAAETQAANSLRHMTRQNRGFASDGHGHGGVTHGGLTMHKPATWHVVTGQGLAGLMWFWIFYRLYNDWDHFVYGPAAHLDHEIHEEEHGSSDGHGHH